MLLFLSVLRLCLLQPLMNLPERQLGHLCSLVSDSFLPQVGGPKTVIGSFTFVMCFYCLQLREVNIANMAMQIDGVRGVYLCACSLRSHFRIQTTPHTPRLMVALYAHGAKKQNVYALTY